MTNLSYCQVFLQENFDSMNFFSSLQRNSIIEKLSSESFDLLVIGGGITGAGIALDAASRGLKTALIEKSDFASGTSSKSTKLIHGGLRYLKQLDIALVREVGKERAIVHKMAPHLVVAEKMLLPLVKGGTYGSFSTSAGLWVYDWLAGVSGADRRRMLSKEETLSKEPLLRADKIIGSGYYAEYRTDDARLTIENIKTSIRFGAVCLNYAEAFQFLYANGQVAGVKCLATPENSSFDIKAQHVINAAGPWVDQVRALDKPEPQGKQIFLSKGVHIVVPRHKLPLAQSAYFDVQDGRMIFAIPRQQSTYIGTTDTPYKGSMQQIPVTRAEVAYLLDAANYMFPDAGLRFEDVESSWAGLRPLIYEEGKSASEMSRKDEIFISSTGLVTMAGGKLTGYRKMAEKVVDIITKKIQQQRHISLPKCQTAGLSLCGGPFANEQEVEAFRKALALKIEGTFSSPGATAAYLVANYGRQSEAIVEKMKDVEGDAQQKLIRAEAWWCIFHELALRPMDFFNRRSGRLFFYRKGLEVLAPVVLSDFAAYLSWDDETLARETQAVERAIQDAVAFAEF